MKRFFIKIRSGKEKVDQFKEENEKFRRVVPLPVMLVNDALPLLVVVAYVLLGVLGNWWHPAWLLFLLIPIYYMTVESIKHHAPAAFPIVFIVTAAYLSVGFFTGLWHPYWALYAAVPVYYMIVAAIKGGSWAKVFDLLVPMATIAAFLLIGFLANAWHPGWVVFFAIPLYYEFKSTVKRYRRQRKGENTSSTYHISAEDIEDVADAVEDAFKDEKEDD